MNLIDARTKFNQSSRSLNVFTTSEQRAVLKRIAAHRGTNEKVVASELLQIGLMEEVRMLDKLSGPNWGHSKEILK